MMTIPLTMKMLKALSQIITFSTVFTFNSNVAFDVPFGLETAFSETPST